MPPGLIPRLPRLLGVQPEGVQPLVRAFHEGAPPYTSTPHTLADGLNCGRPRNATKALRMVRDLSGTFIAVSDEAILDAIGWVARRSGVLPEPASAAAFAGVAAARARGIVGAGESVCYRQHRHRAEGSRRHRPRADRWPSRWTSRAMSRKRSPRSHARWRPWMPDSDWPSEELLVLGAADVLAALDNREGAVIDAVEDAYLPAPRGSHRPPAFVVPALRRRPSRSHHRAARADRRRLAGRRDQVDRLLPRQRPAGDGAGVGLADPQLDRDRPADGGDRVVDHQRPAHGRQRRAGGARAARDRRRDHARADRVRADQLRDRALRAQPSRRGSTRCCSTISIPRARPRSRRACGRSWERGAAAARWRAASPRMRAPSLPVRGSSRSRPSPRRRTSTISTGRPITPCCTCRCAICRRG